MLASLVPLIVAVAGAWAIATVVFTRTLEARVLEETRHATTVMSSGNLPLSPGLLERLAALENAGLLLLDADGRVALSTYPTLPEPVRAAAATLAARGSRDDALKLELDGSPAIAVMAPLTTVDPRYRALIAIAPLRDAREAARRAGIALALAALVACVTLGIILHASVKAITRPLEQLAAFAAGIAGGRRDLRLSPARRDEIGTLARALDDMADRIGTYESQLASQSRLTALGEMAARIAHEVRNPLTGLKMHLQLMSERLPADEARRVRLLLDEVRRLELIVDSSLTLARPRRASPERTELAPLVEDVVSLMRPALEHRGIELSTRLAALPVLALDRGLCRQAILNLIVNGADALPDGGHILVTGACSDDAAFVMLGVEDSGPGFDAAAGSAADGAASGKPFGLGLGLSVCREFAAAQGGVLRTGERSALLGGARCVIELPVRAATSAPATSV